MMPPLHALDRVALLDLLDRSLLRTPGPADAPVAIYAGLGRRLSADLIPRLPPPSRHAAVLVPLVDREDGFHVLLTQRAAHLSNHAGQISFPGGRIESGDEDAGAAALREAAEEIGLASEHVDIRGYLPDHAIVSGFRVTPVVALVRPPYQLAIDRQEVEEAFEVPMNYLMNPQHHRPRLRRFEDREVELTDMPYGRHNIWGATAGMLLTLFSLLAEARDR